MINNIKTLEDFNVPVCHKCKSFDVTLDVDTNVIVCNKCNYKSGSKSTEHENINLQQFKEQMIEKEKTNMDKIKQAGGNIIHIDEPLDKFNI